MELTKNKKRAQRRKRNFHAKALREDRQFRPKVVEPKKKRHKLNVKDVLEELAEEHQDLLRELSNRTQERSVHERTEVVGVTQPSDSNDLDRARPSEPREVDGHSAPRDTTQPVRPLRTEGE